MASAAVTRSYEVNPYYTGRAVNPYQVLGVHLGSTADDIKQAYKSAMRTAHPDAGGSVDAAQVVAGAYKLLNDRRELQKYLQWLALTAIQCPQCKGRGFTFKQRGLGGRITRACELCGGQGCLSRGSKL